MTQDMSLLVHLKHTTAYLIGTTAYFQDGFMATGNTKTDYKKKEEEKEEKEKHRLSPRFCL